ncbi:MAG: phage Gp37/Gp68 family protein [Roseomonas mucosa]|nr:phage Gp37/Gp68 family protein [Roseomonas mucosa]
MAESTLISWADDTFNPWIGCQIASPACDHCYAESWAKRFGRPWGPHGERQVTSEANWRAPLRWNTAAERAQRRRRVFTASLADIFDNKAPEGARDRLWALIRDTPWLDWLILTKRPQNIAGMLPPDWRDGYPNVWLGVTVENQVELDRRVPILRSIPAKVRFLSCEPLLSEITFRWRPWVQERPDGSEGHLDALLGIHWVICGGESGSQARPMHPDWARKLRGECAEAGVAFHFKQWGRWLPFYDRDQEDPDWRRVPRESDSVTRLNLAGGCGFHGDRLIYFRAGSPHANGSLLDGVDHKALPA